MRVAAFLGCARGTGHRMGVCGRLGSSWWSQLRSQEPGKQELLSEKHQAPLGEQGPWAGGGGRSGGQAELPGVRNVKGPSAL